MGQKVNPISLRLEKTNRHFDSCWYDDYNYTDLLLQDLKIKNYLKIVLNQIKYPEGRVLIENLPNKSNVNLFYCNPSLSRQKKNRAFQLQTKTRDTLNHLKKNKKEVSTKKYWKDFFTFAQQTLEGWKSTVCAFPLHGTNTQNLLLQSPSKKTVQSTHTIGTNKVAQNLFRKEKRDKKGIGQIADHHPSFQEKPNDISLIKSTTDKKYTLFLNKEIKTNKRRKTLEKSRNILSYKQGPHFSIKDKILQFILEEREKVKKADSCSSTLLSLVKSEKRDIDKKWVRERFFIRYLLSQLYGKFLQNKSVYSQETLHTLYQWLIFFQERNRFVVYPNLPQTLLHTQNSNKKNQTKKRYKDQILYTEQARRRTGYKAPYGVEKRLLVDSKNEKQIARGLYSSNKFYTKYLEYFLSKQYQNFFNLFFFRIQTEKQGALFLVEDIIYYLERKIPFRRIKSQILKEIPRYRLIRGIRITCSGRVGGRSKKAQRSKTQSVKIGQTPLGVFSSKIDFASKSALTRFGLIGVKVWVCYI